MGKVSIIESLEKGQYIVAPVFNRRAYDEMRAAAVRQEALAVEQLADLEADITEAESELDSAQSALNTALNELIAGIQSGGPSMTPEYQGAFARRQNARAELAGLEAQKGVQIVRRDEARAKINSLDSRVSPEPRLAWCADYVEDAAGEVASIEVPGEPQEPLIIYPQFSDGSHTPARDGLLAPREWQTSPQAFANAAILPGWQKFMPTYRLGVVLAVNRQAGTVDVEMESAASSAQGLEISAPTKLFNVPVRYMDCDAYAFEPDDRVVIKLYQEDEPTVIGFEKEPRSCGFQLYAWVVAGTVIQQVFKSETMRISPAEIDRTEGTLSLESQGSFPYRSLEWPGPRFAVHDGIIYESPYSLDDPTRNFWRGDQIFHSESDGGTPMICCSKDRVFTGTSGRESSSRTEIKVWSIDSLTLLHSWSVANLCSSNEPADDNEALFSIAASETDLLVPISCRAGESLIQWYSHAGVLRNWFLVSSPFRPQAVCSDGKDFAISVEEVLGTSAGAAQVWVYRNYSRIKQLFLPGTTGMFDRRVRGLAMTPRFLFVALTGLNMINIYDRDDDYALVATRHFAENERPSDLAVDSALRD